MDKLWRENNWKEDLFSEKRFVFDETEGAEMDGEEGQEEGVEKPEVEVEEQKDVVKEESAVGTEKMKEEVELTKLTRERLNEIQKSLNKDNEQLKQFLTLTGLEGVIFSGEIPADLNFETSEFTISLMNQIKPKMEKSVQDPKVLEAFFKMDNANVIDLASVSLAALFVEKLQNAKYDHLDKKMLENKEYDFDVKFDEKGEVVIVTKDEKGNVVEAKKEEEIDPEEQKKLSEAERVAKRDEEAGVLQQNLGGVLDFLGFGTKDKDGLTGYQKLAEGHPSMAAFAFILGMLGIDPFGDGRYVERYGKTRGMLGEKGKFLDDLQVQAKASVGEYFGDIIPDEFRDMSKVFKSSKFEDLFEMKNGLNLEEGGVKLSKIYQRPEGENLKLDLSAEGAMVMIPNKERFAAYIEGGDKMPGSIIAQGNVKFDDGILIVSELPKGTIISNGVEVIREGKKEEKSEKKDENSEEEIDEESKDETEA